MLKKKKILTIELVVQKKISLFDIELVTRNVNILLFDFELTRSITF